MEDIYETGPIAKIKPDICRFSISRICLLAERIEITDQHNGAGDREHRYTGSYLGCCPCSHNNGYASCLSCPGG